MIELYTFSSCTSCRKAREILTEHHIPFKERNMNTEPLSKDEIYHILAHTTNGTTDIMSKRSQDVKELEVNFDEISLNKWVDLVHNNPGMLRRPLLLTNDHLIVGYNKEEYEGIVKKSKLKQKKHIARKAMCV
ncbi:Spx/MgsR family RNA polymerase-binding regulatory protein [Bacillus horti]|uniref:Spx/MgsR family RNA polymerase-binding regulatory protein n=1 Tax=Caldalkalibacillus horti TaxID=77523 RepID=UPI0027D7E9DB|nr:Spx/MgsR family RNA polymerase-binding regulatory protein [Bacillus horti]